MNPFENKCGECQFWNWDNNNCQCGMDRTRPTDEECPPRRRWRESEENKQKLIECLTRYYQIMKSVTDVIPLAKTEDEIAVCSTRGIMLPVILTDEIMKICGIEEKQEAGK